MESFSLVNMAGDGAPKRTRVTIDDNVPRRVNGHRAVLMQVLQNLVANAAKRSDVGRPQIELTCVRWADSQISINVAVEDDGKGLLGNDYQNVMKRLSMPKDQLNAELTSLVSSEHGKGLALCQLWLMAIGSQLVLSQGNNRGWNRFSFTIHVEERQPRSAVDLRGRVSFAGRGSVLLVEDNRALAFAARRVLVDWGVSTITACERGEDAVRLAAQGEFSLVLLDIQAGR